MPDILCLCVVVFTGTVSLTNPTQGRIPSQLCGYISVLKLGSLWSALLKCFTDNFTLFDQKSFTSSAPSPCNSLRSDFKLIEWISLWELTLIITELKCNSTRQCLCLIGLYGYYICGLKIWFVFQHLLIGGFVFLFYIYMLSCWPCYKDL